MTKLSQWIKGLKMIPFPQRLKGKRKHRKKKLIGQRAKIPYEEGIVNTVKGLDIPLPKYN